MLKASTIPMLIALAALSQLVHAEVVDESWRQVYDFQSKMAAQGSSKAQFTLGEMYENGRGVAKNYDTAIDWYNKAKSNGHADAEQRITMLNRAIEQQAEDEEKAVAKRKAEKERAQQEAVEQKRAAEAKRKEQARAKKSAAKAKKAAKQKKSAQAKISPEERAKKIKAAQERAKKIAQENEKKQQQEADAALKNYRRSMSAKADADKDEPKATIPEKYLDPFE